MGLGSAAGLGNPPQMSQLSISGAPMQPWLQQGVQQQQQKNEGGAYQPVTWTATLPQQQQQQVVIMPQPMVPGRLPASVPTFVPLFTPHLQQQMEQQQGSIDLPLHPTHSGSSSCAWQMHSVYLQSGRRWYDQAAHATQS